MKIAELYHSIQGEGVLSGTPSVFVRTSGCNLRCWFCDTKFTSWLPEGEDFSVEEIIEQVQSLQQNAKHIVITGGEPMLFSEMVPLTRQLKELGFHITIETSGNLLLPVTCDLMSISPKFSSSAPSREKYPRWFKRHQGSRFVPPVLRELMENYEHQLKFVIDTEEDIKELEEFLAEFSEIDNGKVLLMPQGTEVSELAAKEGWLKPFCDSKGFQYCPRKHIEWFGYQRGV